MPLICLLLSAGALRPLCFAPGSSFPGRLSRFHFPGLTSFSFRFSPLPSLVFFSHPARAPSLFPRLVCRLPLRLPSPPVCTCPALSPLLFRWVGVAVLPSATHQRRSGPARFSADSSRAIRRAFSHTVRYFPPTAATPRLFPGLSLTRPPWPALLFSVAPYASGLAPPRPLPCVAVLLPSPLSLRRRLARLRSRSLAVLSSRTARPPVGLPTALVPSLLPPTVPSPPRCSSAVLGGVRVLPLPCPVASFLPGRASLPRAPRDFFLRPFRLPPPIAASSGLPSTFSSAGPPSYLCLPLPSLSLPLVLPPGRCIGAAPFIRPLPRSSASFRSLSRGPRSSCRRCPPPSPAPVLAWAGLRYLSPFRVSTPLRSFPFSSVRSTRGHCRVCPVLARAPPPRATI